MRRRAEGAGSGSVIAPVRPARSKLAAVRDLAEAGEPISAIARQVGVPLDLAEQMVAHWQRAGALNVVGSLAGVAPPSRSEASSLAQASCQSPDSLACKGCFFARACPSRH